MNVEQIPFPNLIGREFRRGMAFYGDGELIAAHPLPVICNGDDRAAAILITDINLPRARINGVFNQFFDYACRALHHLTRRNAVDGLTRETPNRYGAVSHKKT